MQSTVCMDMCGCKEFQGKENVCSAAPRSSVEGQVEHVRRHGRHLVFVRVSGHERQIVFDSAKFEDIPSNTMNEAQPHLCDCAALNNHQASHPDEIQGKTAAKGEDLQQEPFPAAKSSLKAGDTVHIIIREMDGRSMALQWKRVSKAPAKMSKQHVGNQHAIYSETNPSTPLSGIVSRGRRAGLAAQKGWVQCPLCPQGSLKRFNRGAGLESHLNSVHDDALQRQENLTWEKVHKQADALGIFHSRIRHGSKRNAPTPGAKGSAGQDTSYGKQLRHPGLIAARDGDVDALKVLLLHGWDPLGGESLDCHGASALDWAAGGGHLQCLELLAPAAEGRQACRRDGRGPAHWAARNGQTETLAWILKHMAVQAESPTGDGTTMLMLAAFGGHTSAAELLVADFGAKVCRKNSWGCDAGHFAAMGGNVEMCRWLRQHGLSFARKQSEGHSALHKAAMRGQEEVLRWMLQGGGLHESEAIDLKSACLVTSPSNPDGQQECTPGCTGLPCHEKTARRMKELAHMPSALARKAGFQSCAALLLQHHL